MKGLYDKKHTEREFQAGDWAYLKLQPYRQHSMPASVFHKLSTKYYGPFQVLEKIGEVAYKLQLPPSAKIHNVFHVSLLKKKVGNSVVVESQLLAIHDTSNPRWAPEAILQTRMVKRRGEAATQWLIQWFGTSPDEATWEFAHDIIQRYPDFQF
ncbi:putative chromatin remodeling & transcriptional activation CHROMO-DOMAIN family [Rosa chinensis]|uniref:Putative chromatin remodeling & transcriptional activation CHROMO-DOMAIN family n=1 Tax=Rosa chinensis TaxID=74649 RepID=A0A2P6P3T6_ROSCH|nr:putative chromatin remodeling & transcriptional activation CHROMO-DOMAIN family [Rosa chinensis]